MEGKSYGPARRSPEVGSHRSPPRWEAATTPRSSAESSA